MPQPNSKAHQKAQELIQVYGLNNPPVPITEVASTQGLLLRVANFGEFASQASGYLDIDLSTAFLNQEDDENRQAATIAYLLGMKLLRGSELKEDADLRVCPRAPFTQLSTEPNSQEATEFAACLLLPEPAMSELTKHTFVTPQQLATVFGVPMDLVTFRLGKSHAS